MQTDNRLFDDFARFATGIAGMAGSVRGEAEALIKERLRRLLDDMDLVTREEFEAVKAVAQKARIEQEALEKRIAALEKAKSK